MMAQITFDKEFNFWDILINADIQPSEDGKYKYTEQGDIATLVVYDITQRQLDDALANYNHQAFLDGLPKPQSSKAEILEQQITANTDYLLDVDFRLIMVELGIL